MNTTKLFGASALLLAAGLLGACTTESDPKEPPVVAGGCLEEDGVTLKPNITDDLCELVAGTYRLSALTFVKFGSTVKLHPGVTITGRADAGLNAFIVEKGGILHAVGTPTNPIIFTAGTASPQRGHFGGVALLGRSQVNSPGNSNQLEGIVGVPYGGGVTGTIADDSSGHLQYVRIEYAGRELAPDNELNGLTMAGLGNRTRISHVNQYEGLDDCFEWFGGTVSASYLVATGCDDDIFDYDNGWQGNLQFLVGYHIGITNQDANGIEADGLSSNHEATPRTHGRIANMTLMGNGTSSWNGMRLRRGVSGQIYNSIITGFGGGSSPANASAIRVDDAVTVRLVNNDSLKGHGIYAYGNNKRVHVTGATGDTLANTIAKINTWFTADSTTSVPLGLTRANPKPAAAPAGAVTLPTDVGFVPATYIGAFDPAASTLWINEGNWVRKTNW